MHNRLSLMSRASKSLLLDKEIKEKKEIVDILVIILIDSTQWNSPGSVQPVARGPHAAQDGCECSPTQIVNLLKTL